ncbi:hypothetical protein TTHERM_000900604 (macronuclear) [Tetrahymena thermophila SB210]|uniref:Uncharacterized protein n=1 Tax=Tetrahymena thermophila (strain SB210) TaxID=312017 RepID=W7WZY4_TETTS|nr:hypothetical protein TTHERM_000900604 [Tetrahymena thermophila SB210]EWS71172.1 hypothetical protein TTHERM_000900604 [Tetrahymena thermophila SB210]|eukprot:XP_012656270.1 hypothetical protein TTHERM_000900604 [Tetrahymena thermophila SB210]
MLIFCKNLIQKLKQYALKISSFYKQDLNIQLFIILITKLCKMTQLIILADQCVQNKQSKKERKKEREIALVIHKSKEAQNLNCQSLLKYLTIKSVSILNQIIFIIHQNLLMSSQNMNKWHHYFKVAKIKYNLQYRQLNQWMQNFSQILMQKTINCKTINRYWYSRAQFLNQSQLKNSFLSQIKFKNAQALSYFQILRANQQRKKCNCLNRYNKLLILDKIPHHFFQKTHPKVVKQ